MLTVPVYRKGVESLELVDKSLLSSETVDFAVYAHVEMGSSHESLEC